MQRDLDRLREGGDGAFAQLWLVWAQVHLHTLDVPGGLPTASIEKISPLVYALSWVTHSSQEIVQQLLNTSLAQLLWKAKTEDRDLTVEDGYAALRMIVSALKKGD